MKVKIKTWDEMVAIGDVMVDFRGIPTIRFNNSQNFVREMEEELPEDRIIESGFITPSGNIKWTFVNKNGEPDFWYISPCMVEKNLEDESI